MGWYGLLNIFKQDKALRELDAARTPVACPNDGEPLRSGPDGVLFCINDGWQYPRDWVAPEVC